MKTMVTVRFSGVQRVDAEQIYIEIERRLSDMPDIVMDGVYVVRLVNTNPEPIVGDIIP